MNGSAILARLQAIEIIEPESLFQMDINVVQELRCKRPGRPGSRQRGAYCC